jgi:DHA1 family bicyclomycin/chloramphenicol resistance-like MFS transporter
MLGYVTMGLAMAPMVAPTLGGLLQEFSGWTAIFWLMTALGVGCLVVAWGLIPETNLRPTESLSFGSLFGDFSQLIRRPEFLLFTASSSLTTGVFFTFLGGAPYIAERVMHLGRRFTDCGLPCCRWATPSEASWRAASPSVSEWPA